MWLINTHNGISEKAIPSVNVEEYPAVKRHLDQFYPQLEKRLDKGKTPYNLRNCAYMDDFNRQKISYIEIMTDNPESGYDFPCLSFDIQNCVVLNTAYIMTGNIDDLKYILGILNSKLGRLLVKNYVTQLQQRQFRMLNQDVANFPIPKNENGGHIAVIVDEILLAKNLGMDVKHLEAKVDLLVYELFGFDTKEIAFIECR